MKEDDMDEMLRTAAENYDIDAARAADWDFVYTAVHESETPAVEKTKKRRFAFWWLLLIPLGWIANTQYNNYHAASHTVNNKPPVTAETKANTTKQSLPGKNVLPGNSSTKETAILSGKNASVKSTSVNMQSTALKSYNDQPLTSRNNLKDEYSPLQQQPIIIQPQPQPLHQAIDFNNAGAIKSDTYTVNQQKNDLAAVNKETAAKQNGIAQNATLSGKKDKISTHYFYAGLMAGADLSFVKFQDMQPVGYNLGLLVGYKFNKLSIESGFFLAKKNYYTDGEYFDKSQISFFDSAEVLSANGYCHMYEIPLNIKYDISSRKKHTWFATAGLSSYLMNKEYYNFAYLKDGTVGHGSAPYYHTSQDWFSVINLSAGYQLQTGTKSNLRIEPYYKATLGGVGTGSLSISSIGVNVGITRRIP